MTAKDLIGIALIIQKQIKQNMKTIKENLPPIVVSALITLFFLFGAYHEHVKADSPPQVNVVIINNMTSIKPIVEAHYKSGWKLKAMTSQSISVSYSPGSVYRGEHRPYYKKEKGETVLIFER